MKFILLIFLICSINASLAKKIFNDLLTNDNELLLIEPQKTTSNHNNSKVLSNVKNKPSPNTINQSPAQNDGFKLSSQSNNEYVSKSKFIVNIVYASKVNNHDDLTSKSNLVSNKKKIVYLASGYADPCDKNLCKANEKCVAIKKTAKSAKNMEEKTYKCVAKSKISKRNADNKPTSDKSTITTTKKADKIIQFTNGCDSNTLIDFKLGLFRFFEKYKRNDKDLKQIEKTKINIFNNICIESIAHVLDLLDLDHNELISLDEWLKLDSINKDKCSSDLFNSCDLDDDKSLSFKEFCSCFEGSQYKCKYIRNSMNIEYRKIYIDYLNEKFSDSESAKPLGTTSAINDIKNERVILDIKNYVPLCDVKGNFLPNQCDNKINCWCVNPNGDPIVKNIKRIHENPYDCSNLS